MHIVICSSIDFTPQIAEVADKLKTLGHTVTIPSSSERIVRGEITLEEIKRRKENGTFPEYVKKLDAIRKYWNKIAASDAILVTNFDKKGIKNYVGGNTFLEIGFAHVQHKKIFLLHDIPEMGYTDEIITMEPTILNNDLALIK